MTIVALPILLVTSWVLWDRCEFYISILVFFSWGTWEEEEGDACKGDERRDE